MVPTEDYTHKLIVDDENPNQFVLFWKMINDDEIQFEAHCKSIGWVGIGISSNGGMEGADFAIGWVKDGVAVIKVSLNDELNVFLLNLTDRMLTESVMLDLLKMLNKIGFCWKVKR